MHNLPGSLLLSPMARRRLPRPLGLLIVAAMLVACLLAPTALATIAARGAGAVAAAAGSGANEPPPPVAGPVVLVGTAGVRWSDIDPDRTRILWSLLEHGAAGSVAARSLGSYSCPADGWLAVSTGRLAADRPSSPTAPCNGMDPVSTGEVIPRWPAYLDLSLEDQRDAEPGMLGSALADSGVVTAAVGPGAAIATALTSGVPVGTAAAAPDDTAALAAVVAEVADQADLVVVDIGSVAVEAVDAVAGTPTPGTPTSGTPTPGAPQNSVAARAARVATVDERVGAVLDVLPPGATVLVMSLADDGTEPHLQIALAQGPGRYVPYATGFLGSRSTRQPGLIQTTDIAPTVLSLLGVAPPSTLVGAPATTLIDSATGAARRLQQLRDLDAAAQAVEPAAVRFGVGLVLAHLTLYGGTWLALRQRWGGQGGRRRLIQTLRWLAVLLASIPAATYPANLIPWWRSPAPFATLVVAVLVAAAAVAVVAMLGPWRRQLLGPFGAVAAVTALVLTVDVVTGSRLVLSSLMGSQPLVGGRFYGLGNVAFALFATGGLLLATAAADRLVVAGRRTMALAAVLLIAVACVVIDGAPGLGSDFGGPLAIIPAFAVLAFFVAQLRASWRVGIGVAVATAGVVAALSWLDWLRPADERTHVGRFVEAMVNGETWQVIGRKLDSNIDILLGSPFGLLVPVVGCVLGAAVVQPELMRVTLLQQAYDRAPVLRSGLLAVLVLLVLGFAVNDSGVVVPAVSFALAVPLVVSVCASAALRRQPAQTPPRAPAAAAAP